ncbi:ParM/StbA family protein [Desulfobacula sp.]|uniref:ParM/StbA family protein n=1 Tax=Desulfobacula sp. TaxID=2593537 RepID=UPI00262A83E1|nr:ParM/StbA family protein [Desulfobacula sp.]
MEIVGIDVGFGFTKAYNGKNSVIFKSIIGDATDIQFHSSLDDGSSSSNLHITLEDKSYFLGSYAERQSNIREFTLDQEKLIEEFVKILAIAAAGICTETSAPIQVVSGLPVGYLRRDSKRLKEMILGTHNITFHHKDGQDVKKRIHIDKILIIPQPIGSIFNLLFDDQGQIKDRELATQKIGVVDIGFKTTDFSIFDHLHYIERGSSTLDTGISKCFSVIANKLRQETNINIELYRMFKFVESGMIKIRGKEYNISNLKKRVYTHAASAIASDLNRLWENEWDMDTILLSGGGSVELAAYLTPNINGNIIPIYPNGDARFNNVRGYCKFGRYKWGYAKYISQRQADPKSKEDTADDKNQPDQSPDPKDATVTPPSKGLSWLKRQS